MSAAFDSSRYALLIVHQDSRITATDSMNSWKRARSASSKGWPSRRGDHSRNNWFVSLISVGEGWHNNHHHDPASGCNQHRWWELDLTYYELKGLELLGLATNVIRPRHQRKRET